MMQLPTFWKCAFTLEYGGKESKQWNNPKWSNIHEDGGQVTLEESEWGLVYRLQASGEQSKRRIQLDKHAAPGIAPPFAFESEFVFAGAFPKVIIRETVASMFREVPYDGGTDYDLIATLRFTGSTFEVATKKPYSGEDHQVVKTAGRIEPGLLQTLRAEVPDEDTLRVWLQGNCIAEVKIPRRVGADGKTKPLLLRQINPFALYGEGIPSGAILIGVRAEIQTRNQVGRWQRFVS